MKIKHWAVTRTWEALASVISGRAGRSSALRGAEVLRRLEQLDRPRLGATHDADNKRRDACATLDSLVLR